MKEMIDIIVDKYGPRLNTSDLALALRKSPEYIRNWISAGTFPIKTYKESETQSAPRYADARDVAEYLDHLRDRAA